MPKHIKMVEQEQEYKKLEFCLIKVDHIKHAPTCLQCNFFEKADKLKDGYTKCRRRGLYVLSTHLSCGGMR